MIDRIRKALYRWRVRRAFARNGWPLFVAFVLLVGCAHFRQQRRDIRLIERSCIDAMPNIPTDQLEAHRADCEARIRQVQHE